MAPAIDKDNRVDSQQLRKLKLSDFQSTEIPESTTQVPQTISNTVSESGKTAAQLRSARDRFAEGVPLGGNRLCYLVDRAAALAVYQEALLRLNSKNHQQIQSEANIKIQTVLGIRQAEADDIVFVIGGMLLSPLEPQYAEPRIEFSDDPYGRKAAWRLKAWRKDGWPKVYPSAAVEDEKKRNGALRKGDRGDAELLQRMKNWDDIDWGEQVDANPGSWGCGDVEIGYDKNR